MAGWLKLPKVKYPEAEAARQEKQEKYIIQRHQWQPVRRRSQEKQEKESARQNHPPGFPTAAAGWRER